MEYERYGCLLLEKSSSVSYFQQHFCSLSRLLILRTKSMFLP